MAKDDRGVKVPTPTPAISGSQYANSDDLAPEPTQTNTSALIPRHLISHPLPNTPAITASQVHEISVSESPRTKLIKLGFQTSND